MGNPRTLIPPSEAAPLGIVVGRFTLAVPTLSMRTHSYATVMAREAALGFVIQQVDGAYRAGIVYDVELGDHGSDTKVRWLISPPGENSDPLDPQVVPIYYGYRYDDEALLGIFNILGHETVESLTLTRLDDGELRLNISDRNPTGTHRIQPHEVLFPTDLNAGGTV